MACAGGEDQWVLLVEFRLAVGAHRRLLEVGQRLLPPGCQQRRPQLDSAGRRVESHLAVGALLALLELAVVELGVDPVELAGLVVGDAGLLDEVGEVLLKRFTWPEVLVPAAAELPVDLEVVFRFAHRLAGLVGVLDVVPHRAQALALWVEAQRQHDVAVCHECRRHEAVDAHDELAVSKTFLDAGLGVLRAASERVGRLDPCRADLERTSGDQLVDHGVRLALAHAGVGDHLVVGADALFLLLGGEDLAGIGRQPNLGVVRVVHGDHAAGDVDLAGDAPQVAQRLGSSDALQVHVDGQAPLHGSRLLRHVLRSSDDVFLVKPGDLRCPVEVVGLASLLVLLEAVAPFLDELVVIEVVLHDVFAHG